MHIIRGGTLDAVFVSWSKSDPEQISHEMESKHIVIERMQEIFDDWIDCQEIFADKMSEQGKQYSLKEALIAADINYDEHIHDGLIDARNTAELFIKMKKEPVLKLNKYYVHAKKGKVDDEEDQITLGDMFPWLSDEFSPEDS